MPRVRLRSDAKSPAETLELLSGAPLCSEFIRTPEPQGPAETLKKIDVSALHHWECDKSFISLVPGRFWWGTEGFPTEIEVFPIIWHTLRCPPYGSRQQTLQPTPSLLARPLFVVTSFLQVWQLLRRRLPSMLSSSQILHTSSLPLSIF